MKKTSHRLREILESHISDKGIVPKIQKNANNSILKMTYNSIFKKEKILIEIITKKTYERLIEHQKMLNIINH